MLRNHRLLIEPLGLSIRLRLPQSQKSNSDITFDPRSQVYLNIQILQIIDHCVSKIPTIPSLSPSFNAKPKRTNVYDTGTYQFNMNLQRALLLLTLLLRNLLILLGVVRVSRAVRELRDRVSARCVCGFVAAAGDLVGGGVDCSVVRSVSDAERE